jgi:hypothetical protein
MGPFKKGGLFRQCQKDGLGDVILKGPRSRGPLRHRQNHRRVPPHQFRKRLLGSFAGVTLQKITVGHGFKPVVEWLAIFESWLLLLQHPIRKKPDNQLMKVQAAIPRAT